MGIGYMAEQPDEFEKMHAKLTPAEIKRFSDEFEKMDAKLQAELNDFMMNQKKTHVKQKKTHVKLTPTDIVFPDDFFNDDSHLSSSAPEGASTTNRLYIQNKTDYDTAVRHTHEVIEDAIKKIKTSGGLLALYKVILKHYNSILNHSRIPDPPDEKTTDFTSDIFSDENYRQIMDESVLITIVNKCLSSLYTMCVILYPSNNGIYIDYSLKMNEWLRMILEKNQTQQLPSKTPKIYKKQQPSSKKGGKSRSRHRKTKRKPYSRRRR
jgi:hypothetical protein